MKRSYLKVVGIQDLDFITNKLYNSPQNHDILTKIRGDEIDSIVHNFTHKKKYVLKRSFKSFEKKNIILTGHSTYYNYTSHERIILPQI